MYDIRISNFIGDIAIESIILFLENISELYSFTLFTA